MNPKTKSNQNHIAEVGKKVAHTPTPWHCAPGEFIYGANGESVASCRFVTNFKDENIENIRLIVRAVNSQQENIELLKDVQPILEMLTKNIEINRAYAKDLYLKIEKSIALAEGGTK